VLGKLIGGGLGVEFIDRTIAGNLVLYRRHRAERGRRPGDGRSQGMELGRDLVLPPDAVDPDGHRSRCSCRRAEVRS
jgi:hypothetical protein